MSRELNEKEATYKTEGGISVIRTRVSVEYSGATARYIDLLDERRGAVLSSNYEYPGRYTRWDTAFVDPPLMINACQRDMRISVLNDRGKVLMPAIDRVLRHHPDLAEYSSDELEIVLRVKTPAGPITEEERSRVPSVFTVVREIVDLFKSSVDGNLGLYGTFGYDLAFQFDPIELTQKRPDDQRDLVLYLPDEILVVDHHAVEASVLRYEFIIDGRTTIGLQRDGSREPFVKTDIVPPRGDHEPGEFAQVARKAVEYFRRGDLFECVPGQTFYEPCRSNPSQIARKLQEINPSPYGFVFNLGNQEYLVGASPEMFVRVTGGRRIETCPISGTIKRGTDAISDSVQILKLLNSKKDESELTMCSDVDRNDKSRVCEPGSVRVIGRRQIEMYSRLIHTVDHIEGRLKDGFDALDGFLSHAWAVTVTGAPKLWAMEFIEKHEKSPRAWYGGAIGFIGFDGNMNTGLTLRTIRIKDGIAQVRAGATLLFDSDPEDEEAETELKASALITAIREASTPGNGPEVDEVDRVGLGMNILLVDHQDSFVHTLANYFRQTGANVTTVRTPIVDQIFEDFCPDLLVMSPGPGNPKAFDTEKTIRQARDRNIPIFGVCLGLQALTEAFGGTLNQLDVPVHGKPSAIHVSSNSVVFKGLPDDVVVGRYHSLHADRDTLPDTLRVTAETDDGVIMGIEHVSEPICAVQFHPESIMSLGQNVGMRMIENVVRSYKKS